MGQGWSRATPCCSGPAARSWALTRPSRVGRPGPLCLHSCLEQCIWSDPYKGSYSAPALLTGATSAASCQQPGAVWGVQTAAPANMTMIRSE